MGEAIPTDNIERVERELAKEDSLFARMLEQAPGMLGMAIMFVVTIAIGIWLRPFFDEAGLYAFGESGTTQGRWIIMELLAIFAFTFVILWLAKNHKEKIIKYGLLIVLFLALCYTTVPGAHLLLVDDPVVEPFVFVNMQEMFDEEIVFTDGSGEMLTQISNWEAGEWELNRSVVISKSSAFSENTSWEQTLDVWPGEPLLNVVEGEYAYTVTNAAWAWSLDKQTGEVLSKYQCFESATGGNGTNETIVITYYNLQGVCGYVLEVIDHPTGELNDDKGSIYIITKTDEFARYATFHGTNTTTLIAKWALPPIFFYDNPIHISQFDEKHLYVGSNLGSIIIELEETADAAPPGNLDPAWVDEAKDAWNFTIADGDNITAFAYGESMYDDEIDYLMVFGYASGKIEAYNWDDEKVVEETRMFFGNHLSGPITALSLQDENQDGWNEIWIADSDGVHGFYHTSLVGKATLDLPRTIDIVEDSENNTTITTVVELKYLVINNSTIATINQTTVITEITTVNQDGEEKTNQHVVTVHSGVYSGPFSEKMYNISGIYLSGTAFLIGVALAALLMAALIIRPEWYIVNTVGVLVGAGVIVMLGVTFVPTLILIFMVLAAIYDAWAVYRSKHMLDLADTMIGLNLPILLVAPQEKGYSMLDEQESVRDSSVSASSPRDSDSPVIPVKRKKPKEAMFMGLGDVIFPGMLVVSCVQYIAVDGLAVGISALIGGLVGYFVLMGFVASGRPQAGLPLLNGGAILGYIIGGLFFVGTAAFKFGISL